MNWSLNEIEALARKAARGAGYPWGLAEEAGRSVRWLCARDLPGLLALLALLRWRDACAGPPAPPVAGSGIMRDARSESCPIMLGAMLIDGQISLGDGRVVIERVAAPLLLVPFAGWAAASSGHPLQLSWGTVRMEVTPAGDVFCAGEVSSHEAARVEIGPGEAPEGAAQPIVSRAVADDRTIDAISEFAARTYAPATDQSRHSGAGAGLLDND